MTHDEILELERKHIKQRLEHDLQQAKFETQQNLINFGMFMICEQMKLQTIAMLRGIDIEDGCRLVDKVYGK